MKIEPTRAWKIGEGAAYTDLSEAQKVALKGIICPDNATDIVDVGLAAQRLVEHPDEVVDILTMSENARPRARKINGAKRKPKAAPAQVTDITHKLV